ncbi:MAG: hypothetical protein COU10_00400 [Candidatus Harrisonbacteria bacterium CG10_big_fil_rev_8_21_14_0_10_45_28]|uniref:Class F sortase n=1 Tax=Candidatus Harrisonbacteria bacterium CG10_big_fil_rev_8_21_14_0_10_45_28 TaxID=1974586 RepID=A0A2H0UP62_9BACT|nr:MAG: hypothetical protein COU10_00400 [Candidatus Harrisonbacteria bacterium CG10_big_fil_rev_8_21_14_0_10_45_28]
MQRKELQHFIAAATLTLVAGGLLLAVLYIALLFRVPTVGVSTEAENPSGRVWEVVGLPNSEIGSVAVEEVRGEPVNNETPVVVPVAKIVPVKILIPRLDIEAKIQAVGKTTAGNMGTSSGTNKYKEVAWYKGGASPGEIGNAVIAGHLDNGYGLSAVFKRLSDLEVGDSIFTVDSAGAVSQFRVIKKAFYGLDSAPLSDIFGYSNRANLNLITCDGAWISSERQYDKRLVVYTTLVE